MKPAIRQSKPKRPAACLCGLDRGHSRACRHPANYRAVVSLTPQQCAALQEWTAARKLLDAVNEAVAQLMESLLAETDAATRERCARASVIAAFELSTEEGMRTVDLGDGWALKHHTLHTRTLDTRAAVSLRTQLEAQHTSLDTIVEWKAQLKLREYRQLTAEARAVIDAAITTTQGKTSIEILPPCCLTKED